MESSPRASCGRSALQGKGAESSVPSDADGHAGCYVQGTTMTASLMLRTAQSTCSLTASLARFGFSSLVHVLSQHLQPGMRMVACAYLGKKVLIILLKLGSFERSAACLRSYLTR